MKLQAFINNKYEGKTNWFVEEVQQFHHKDRINKALDNKSYLDGKHKVLKRRNEVHNKKHFETRKIVLDMANLILDFQSSYLLKNKLTLTSNDIDVLKEYKRVYREGKFDRADYEILSKMIRTGEVAEYIYLDENRRIKSKLIDTVDGYPVYDFKGNYIAFIEFYISNSIPYYTIYTETKVEEYIIKNEDMLYKVGEYSNLSGLPVVYRLPAEEDELTGKSDLDRWKNIIDNMEDILSKYTDALYRHIDGVGVLSGEKLSIGENGEGGIDPHTVGNVLQIEGGSTFDFKQNNMDYNSFKEIYSKLSSSLLNVSATPSIAVDGSEVSNVSESSVRMMYEIANVRATQNEHFLMIGLEKRFGQIKKLLNVLGYNIPESAYISCTFNYNLPESRTGIIDDLVKATGNKPIMSIERAIEVNPFTLDVALELELLKKEQEKKLNLEGLNYAEHE